MVYDLNEYRSQKAPKTDTPSFNAAESKLPPQSVECEEMILGGCMIDPYAIERVVNVLKPDAFYVSAHRHIYQAIVWLHVQELPTDPTSIVQRLADLELLKAVGGQSKIAALLETTVSTANIDQYAKLVIEKRRRRELIRTCSQIALLAHNGQLQWGDVIEQAEQQIFGLSDSAAQKGLAPLSDLLVSEFDRITSLSEGTAIAGYSTGFYDLDAMTQGFKPGNLIIVAGRPSMGKSAFAANVALNIAKTFPLDSSQNLPVAIFSLEMSGGEVARRMLSAEARIDASSLGSGRLQSAEWEPLGHASASLSNLPLAIDESECIGIQHIRSQARKFKAENNNRLGLIVIDYLHLMLDGGDDEVKELGRITRASKRLARELSVPVVLLSQLSRGVESRNEKRPIMSDLRQSGAIEQDADLILMLYRDEYYNPDTPDRGIAEVIVLKNRGGQTGTVKLLFEPQFTQFKNLATGRSAPPQTPQWQAKKPASNPKVEAFDQWMDEALPTPLVTTVQGAEVSQHDGFHVGDVVTIALDRADSATQKNIRKFNECPHEGKTTAIKGFKPIGRNGLLVAVVDIDGEETTVITNWLKHCEVSA